MERKLLEQTDNMVFIFCLTRYCIFLQKCQLLASILSTDQIFYLSVHFIYVLFSVIVWKKNEGKEKKNQSINVLTTKSRRFIIL